MVSQVASKIDCHTQNLHRLIIPVAPTFQEFRVYDYPAPDRTIPAPFQVESKVLHSKN
jgi:hypothetical protein